MRPTQSDHLPDSSALTPAFSPRERENRSPFGGESITHGRSRVSALNRGAHGASGSDVRLTKDARGQFPLPVGEGQGEGEGSLQLSGTRRFALRGTLFPFVYRPAVIGQRMRGALLQRPPNCVADGLVFAPQPGVAEAKHLDAARFQLSAARKALVYGTFLPSDTFSPTGGEGWGEEAPSLFESDLDL